MSKPLKAVDLLPLVASLEPRERVRLMRLVPEQGGSDESAVYAAVPPVRDEFSSDEDPLAWEADDWEKQD